MNGDMDTRRVQFWSGRKGWPGNYLGKIFLGNAVHIIGMQLYGAAWTEGAINRLRSLPDLPDFTIYMSDPDAYLGEVALIQGRQLLTLDGQNSLSAGREGKHLSREELEALTEIFARDAEHVRTGREMWTEAVATISKGFIAGDIATFYQTSLGGGGWTPMPPELWVVNDPVVLLERFVVCAFDPEAPFVTTDKEPCRRLIFVEDAGLVRFRENVAAVFGQSVRGALVGVQGGTPPSQAEVQEDTHRADLEPAASRQSPQQQKVMPVLAKLYPNGIPSRSDLTDAELFQRVGAEMGSATPSRDTVLRAAGRKQ